MNKKILIIALVMILGAAGFLGWKMLSGGKEKEEAVHIENKWNPYAEEEKHVVTLSDMIVSASNGKYIIKMTNTLEFTDKESHYKFKGFSDKEAAELAAAEGGHGGDEEHVTPMEIKINDTISDLMLKANDNQIFDKKMLKAYLIEGMNKELGFETPIISDMFIENYVVQ
jgi:flagellar basal body-associated protein FliL